VGGPIAALEAEMITRTIALVGIVDDDKSVRDSISSLLRSAGYKTMVFESAEAFLDADGAVEPDCLVLDVRMPGLSGLQLQSQLRDMGRQTPVIFVSAHNDSQVQTTAFHQGAAAFLGKPFSDEVLLGAIHSAIGADEASAS
jgi:FixJ family two-component response regulator